MALLFVALHSTIAAGGEPVYWRQRVFFIPYQPAEQGLFVSPIDKVQLLVARHGVGQWAVLQEAEPHVRGFSYHAPADGQYDFALRTRDRKGNLSPEAISEPQLRVVVDTTPPAIELNAGLDATGRIAVRYEARDLHLRPETLRLDAQVDGGAWQPVATGPPDISQPDRVLGQLTWKPPTGAGRIQLRATVDDRAGNQGAITTQASLVTPVPSNFSGPLLGSAAGGLQALPPVGDGPAFPPAVTQDSSASGPTLTPPASAHESPWASVETQSMPAMHQPVVSATAPPVHPPTPSLTPPPVQNPYASSPLAAQSSDAPGAAAGLANPFNTPASVLSATSATPNQTTQSNNAQAVTPPWMQSRTSALLVGDNGTRPTASTGGSINPFAPPRLFDAPSPLEGLPPASANGNLASKWSDARSATSAVASPASPLPGEPASESPRWVNALTFDVDYEVQTVGPWGVSKVELWATNDGGHTWVNMGADPDNRAPMRVTVPSPGLYGFRLVVTGANGAPPPNPASGQPPELSIGVDMQEPQAELKPAELGEGNLADHLIIRWTASDEHLDPRPTALFYSTNPEGPWTTIATDLENNGQYAWRLMQQIPERLFLRLEVRDRAGNIAVRQSPAPVALNLPQPTGRLRSVRPVKEPEDPGRFRTADGPSKPSAVR